MRILPLPILVLCTMATFGQDTLKIKQIDFLVMGINNNPDFKIYKDSLSQNHPEMGFLMNTYLTMVLDGNELKKYVSYMISVRKDNGNTTEMTASQTFFYDKSKLIKVEEFMVEGDKKANIDWYYSDGLPLYNTLKPRKQGDNVVEVANERANLLLNISKTLQKQAQAGLFKKTG